MTSFQPTRLGKPTQMSPIRAADPGAWSSLPELVSSAFRGKDLILDRHFEIGFRCACDCPSMVAS